MRAIHYCAMFLVTILFAAAFSEEAPAAKSAASGIKTIAVLDMEGSGLEAGEIKTLSEALRVEIMGFNRFTVMERSKMDMILKEQGFQQSGACNDDACMVEIGQLLGVEGMIAGSIGKVGSTYSIAVRLFDVRTGKILVSSSQFFKGEIDKLLTEVVSQVAEKIVRTADQTPAAAATARKESPREEPAPAAAPEVGGKKGYGPGFYAAIGAVVVGGGAAAYFLLGKKEDAGGTPPPAGTGDRPSFPTPPSAGN